MQETRANGQRTKQNIITRWWRSWMGARSSAAQLDHCGRHETNRIARDLQLEGHELRGLAGKWPDAAEELNGRLRALGLDQADIARGEPEVLRDLQRTCSMCGSKRPCVRDLVRDESDPQWRTYCPNVTTLDALAAEREIKRATRRAARRQSRSAEQP